MKIYELRDTTSDESYYTKGFFDSKKAAIGEASNSEAWSLADEAEDCVILGVYEWELGEWDKGHKKVYEVTFTKDWAEEDEAKEWSHEVTHEEEV